MVALHAVTKSGSYPIVAHVSERIIVRVRREGRQGRGGEGGKRGEGREGGEGRGGVYYFMSIIK